MKHPFERLPLFDHALSAPSAFTPESLLEAVRVERDLSPEPAPEICLLDFDGDFTDWMVSTGQAVRCSSWACFHTAMETFAVDGERCGLIARTIGGPYSVLVSEQLAASGVRVILGLTSAGRVSTALSIPSLVIARSAIRDEGTSYHYLPPAEGVEGDAVLARLLGAELSALGLPVQTGAVWTTDAPYRETREQLDRHAAAGVLAVEMQAAALFAFAQARRVFCGVVAHVTNAVDHTKEQQFEKGGQELSRSIATAMCRAGRRRLAGRLS